MNKAKVVAFALAFSFILLTAAAQPAAAASRYDSLRSYMNERYDSVMGGYSVPGEGVVSLDPTYGAISIMNEVGTIENRPPPISITTTMDLIVDLQYLSGRQDLESRYGGFSDYVLGPVTNGGNYRALVIWQILKSQGGIPNTEDYAINATANLLWINKTQTESGGFVISGEALDEGSHPDLLSTAYALMAIRILDDNYEEEDAWSWLHNETATVAWIESCRDGNAYKLSPDSQLPSVTATAAAVMAYHALDMSSVIPNRAGIITWLSNRQVPDGPETELIGGFEEGNGTEASNLLSTYYAISALGILNGLSTINATAAENFVLNCQTSEGSFANSPGFSTGELLYSGYACEILNQINPNGAMSSLSSVDPFSVEETGFEWRTYFIVGIIVIAVVLAILAVRAD
jgi:prenyltransferase beta subunit